MQDLSPRLHAFRSAALEQRVTRGTRELYARRVAEIRACGPLDHQPYATFMAFLERHCKRFAASTLRGYKSALVHHLRQVGRRLSDEESDDLDEIVQGIAAEKGPPPAKGPITQERLGDLVQWCHSVGQHLYADGFVVLSGICCRPRDIAELTVGRVDLAQNTVAVRAKRSRVKIAELGAFEVHEIGAEGARIILRSRLAGRTDSQPLFPGWRPEVARRLVKSAALQNGWPMDEMLFNGPHCLRHGAATQRFADALAEAQRAGAWRAQSSTRRYAEPEVSRRQRKRPRQE